MTIANTEISFKDFLFKNKRNRTFLWIAAAAIVIQFAVFKYFYPFASYIHGDSFSYLEAAEKNLDINTYMIGYSKFLRLFSVFTNSDTILTAFQYLFLHLSSSFLLFSIFYFYIVSRVTQFIIVGFITFNPLFLHLGNLVSSDCLFLSLSLIWFTSLLWILERSSLKVAFLHILVLFAAFTIRYNALIYPILSIFIIMFSQLSYRSKFLSVFFILILCGQFVAFTTYNYKKLTGIWQYSPFSGWQWANNAMYAYKYVDINQRKNVPQRFQVLDKMIRQYFDSTRDTKRFPHEALEASTVYMWSAGLPLFKYRDNIFKKNDTSVSELKKWASMGPFYKDYGIYIIKQYPWAFVRHFLWPNANKYYAPPVEFLNSYNSGRDEVTLQAKNWFKYNSQKIKSKFKDPNVSILEYYPTFSGIVNLLMLSCLVCFILLKGWRYNFFSAKSIFLAGVVWLANALFTIGASSAALRFQSFPIVLAATFSAFLIDWMIRVMKVTDNGAISLNSVKNRDQTTLSQQIV